MIPGARAVGLVRTITGDHVANAAPVAADALRGHVGHRAIEVGRGVWCETCRLRLCSGRLTRERT